MRKAIIFSIITLGITSIVAQLIIIRELIISFYGNEFFIGWIFLSWLFWTGIGSLFLNKIFKSDKYISKILVLCHILITLFLPLVIFLTRLSRTFIAGPTGQIPNLIPALGYSFLIVAPLCLILGLQFAVVARFWKSTNKKPLSKILGKSYLLETFGFIIGGLLFSYFLILLNEFQAISVLAWINLGAAGFIILSIKKLTPQNKSFRFIAGSLIIILIIIFIGISIFSKDINNQTNAFRFPNQKLVILKNSIYGNIAVTKLKDQYNFYESGLFLGAGKEEIFNEYLAHLSLLYHPNPKKILLIGNGFNGILKEILKHQPEQVSYLELDPSLIEIVKKYLTPEIRQDLESERVKIINEDARYFLKTNSENFDVVIINLPNPSTGLINRFYTEDFLKEIKSHLAPQGILVSYISSSPNYLGPETENLDASLFKSLKKHFDSIIYLPEDNHFFIVSDSELSYDPEILINRFKERNLSVSFVNSAYIEYRLTNDRVQQMLSILEKNQEAKSNQDQLPTSYYYNFTYWTSVFYPRSGKFLLSLTKIDFVWIIAFIILLLAILLWGLRGKQSERLKGLLLAMAIAGFSLMAAELIIIFGFQIFYGYLYYKIALIITVLMAGMALGSWLGVKKINQAKIKTVIKIHLLIILFSIILFSIFYFLFTASPRPSIIIEMIFLIMAGLIGAIVGFEFPIINKLYLEKSPRLKLAGQAGVIYGADLLGSCLGAFLVSIFLIPIFGIYQTIIFLAVINVLVLIPISFLQKPEQ